MLQCPGRRWDIIAQANDISSALSPTSNRREDWMQSYPVALNCWCCDIPSVVGTSLLRSTALSDNMPSSNRRLDAKSSHEHMPKDTSCFAFHSVLDQFAQQSGLQGSSSGDALPPRRRLAAFNLDLGLRHMHEMHNCLSRCSPNHSQDSSSFL
jgi:hypothetical protein